MAAPTAASVSNLRAKWGTLYLLDFVKVISNIHMKIDLNYGFYSLIKILLTENDHFV